MCLARAHTNPRKAKAGHHHGNLPARAWPTHGDGKHPVRFEYVGQHPPVAKLKMCSGRITSGNSVALLKIINGILTGISIGEKCTKHVKMEETTQIRGCHGVESGPLFRDYERIWFNHFCGTRYGGRSCHGCLSD